MNAVVSLSRSFTLSQSGVMHIGNTVKLHVCVCVHVHAYVCAGTVDDPPLALESLPPTTPLDSHWALRKGHMREQWAHRMRHTSLAA